jgi:hypothetical protein
MFRRPLRRPIKRSLVNRVPPALQRANQLMANGAYSEAAEMFSHFANGALMRNGPRAPWFFLQAGQANMLGGNITASLEQFQKGLKIFADRGQMQQLSRAGSRIVNDLQSKGHFDAAKQMEGYLKEILPTDFVLSSTPSAKVTRTLPTKCPGCGGPIRSDEVEWADDVTAECPYCGSSIRAE